MGPRKRPGEQLGAGSAFLPTLLPSADRLRAAKAAAAPEGALPKRGEQLPVRAAHCCSGCPQRRRPGPGATADP